MQISIYDDRVEILSPGVLYGGLDMEAALAGKSKCRNAAVSEAFHYMKIIEAWGTGLGRIRSSCKEYGLKEPVIQEFGDGFRVILYRFELETDQKAGNGWKQVHNTDQKMGSEIKNMGSDFGKYRTMLEAAGITKIFIANIENVYCHTGDAVFKQSDVMEYLSCSKSKAGNVIHAMKQAGIIKKVAGMGQGRYQFISSGGDSPV